MEEEWAPNTRSRLNDSVGANSIKLIQKEILIIEKQLPLWIIKYIKCLIYPLPFYAIQIINPFLNSRISLNHDKVVRLSANGEIIRKEIVSLL